MEAETVDTRVTLVKKDEGRCFFSYRWLVSFMAALGTMNVYSLRNAMNVAVVTMVAVDGGNIGWSKTQQGLVMGAYYWGYVPTNLPGAWFAKRFGIRNVFAFTSLGASIVTIFFPLAAKTSLGGSVAVRVILGLLSGVAFPVVYTACGVWAPANERSRHLAIGFSGTSTGNFLVFPLIGLIIDAFGWEAVFYFTGGFGIAWSVAWWIIARDTPGEHPWVTNWEKNLISSGMESQPEEDDTKSDDKGKVPWLSIATSLPFWALVIPHVTENYLSSTTVSWFPTYMKNFLGFDIKSAAFLASLPYLMKFFVQILSAFLADFIISKGWWGKTITVRKVFTCVGFLFPCIAYIIVGIYKDCPVPFAVFLLVVGESFLSFCYPGYRTVFLDIAPLFSGILYAVSNTIASVLAMLAPIITGKILESDQIVPQVNSTMVDNSTTAANATTSSGSDLKNLAANASQDAWGIVFYVSSVIAIVGLIVFLIFGTNDEQPWNNPNKKKEDDNDAGEEDKML